MNRQPDKLEEPAAPYGAKQVPEPSAASGLRYAGLGEVRKSNEKLMQVHRKVLQKLAK
ncbi:MAG: hypothetical protein IT582_02900 [Opitutaceae bacterium]|nr:hypothetical protein [Opitutaceae bacterium]